MADEKIEFVRIVSKDGFTFHVDKKAALISNAIKSMLTGPGEFQESSGECKFEDIRGKVMQKVCEYFYFKLKYGNSTIEIPEFPMEPDIALELLMAANFLDT